MFMVGDELWLEEEEYFNDIPNFRDFSGCVRWCSNGVICWFVNGAKKQSYLSPATGEWLPALVWPDGSKFWFNNGNLHSFPSVFTGELMPAIIRSNRSTYWYRNGKPIPNPNVEGK